ncbi:MAG: hypothetical protein U0930_09610 [Pirellulales bacterium]
MMTNLKTSRYPIAVTVALSFAILGCNNNQAAAPTVVGNPAAIDVAAAPAQLPLAQRATSAVCKSGAKLRDNNDAQKIVTGAPGVLLDVKLDTVFNIQIPQALQLFKASEGKVPKNHADFVAKVLEPNNLKLPELIDGMVYQFNPEREELWAYPKDQVPSEK